ncbi:hypothetical protein HK096_009161 [Nowakowskiella sp. JEL0078]|nr:hypothetical protein HK096_009161 [Nowakowskiella sp. JEL0078]
MQDGADVFGLCVLQDGGKPCKRRCCKAPTSQRDRSLSVRALRIPNPRPHPANPPNPNQQSNRSNPLASSSCRQNARDDRKPHHRNLPQSTRPVARHHPHEACGTDERRVGAQATNWRDFKAREVYATSFLFGWARQQECRSELHDFGFFRDAIDVQLDVKVVGAISVVTDPGAGVIGGGSGFGGGGSGVESRNESPKRGGNSRGKTPVGSPEKAAYAEGSLNSLMQQRRASVAGAKVSRQQWPETDTDRAQERGERSEKRRTSPAAHARGHAPTPRKAYPRLLPPRVRPAPPEAPLSSVSPPPRNRSMLPAQTPSTCSSTRPAALL